MLLYLVVVPGLVIKISIIVVALSVIITISPFLTSGHFINLKFVAGDFICTNFIDVHLWEIVVQFHFENVCNLYLCFNFNCQVGGFLSSAILFLVFFCNKEIKSLITWGYVSFSGQIPEDLTRALPHL